MSKLYVVRQTVRPDGETVSLTVDRRATHIVWGRHGDRWTDYCTARSEAGARRAAGATRMKDGSRAVSEVLN